MSNLDDFPFDPEDIVVARTVGDFVWVASRGPVWGAVNGYVRLPDDHPWLEIEIEYKIPSEIPWGEITFRDGNWIGFDTLHGGQYWPGMPWIKNANDQLMTQEIAIAWTEMLCDQAILAQF